jgi:hypothetical protein
MSHRDVSIAIPKAGGQMDYYPHEELDTIETNPKRRHVAQLVAEVKRLTALAAEQLLNDRSSSMHGTFKETLRHHLCTRKSQWPLYVPLLDRSMH